MEYGLSAAEQALAQEVAEWVADNLPDGWDPFLDTHTASGSAMATEWRQRLARKGWLASTASSDEPKAAAGDHVTRAIVEEALACCGAWVWDPGVSDVAPALLARGSPGAEEAWLPAVAGARYVWGLAYWEPESQPSLPSVQTRAEETQDGFTISGTKLLASGQSGVEILFLLARTNPRASGHEGLAFFVVPVDTPGVHLQPSSTPAPTQFVQLKDVEIGRSNLVGQPGQGWQIARALQEAESPPMAVAAGIRHLIGTLVEIGKEVTSADGVSLVADNALRHRLAQLAVEANAARALCYQAAWQQARGSAWTKEMAIAQLFTAELHRRAVAAGVETLAQAGEIPGRWGSLAGWLTQGAWRSVPRTLWPETWETRRTLIATRGLGLPSS